MRIRAISPVWQALLISFSNGIAAFAARRSGGLAHCKRFTASLFAALVLVISTAQAVDTPSTELPCESPTPLLSADLDPNLTWQWSLSYASQVPWRESELRLYRTKTAYRLVSLQFANPVPDGWAYHNTELLPQRLRSLRERELHPAVAHALSQIIGVNVQAHVDTQQRRAAGIYREEDDRQMMGFDIPSYSVRTSRGCAPLFDSQKHHVYFYEWELAYTLLTRFVNWQMGPAEYLLQAAAVSVLDRPERRISSPETDRLFRWGAFWLYVILLLPGIMAAALCLLPNRPKHPFRFACMCMFRVYGLSALTIAALSPCVIYALYLGGSPEFAGMPVVAAAGDLMLGGGVFAWMALSLTLPIVMRWRRMPRECFEPN